MSEQHPRAPAPDRGAAQVEPKPRIRRIGRSTVAVVVVALFALLTLLTFRYSREAVEREAAGREAMPTQPLRPDQIARLRPPAPPQELSIQPEVAEASPAPGPPPRLPRRRPPRRSVASSFTRSPGAAPARAQPLLPGDPFAPREAPALPAQPPEPPDPRVLSPAAGSAAQVGFAAPAPGRLIPAGTYIPAVLAQALSSELAGPVRAYVSRDVYSYAGTNLLIPRGSVLWGHQARQPLLGESRLVVAWHRLLLPDGRTLDLPSGEDSPPAAGRDGSVGISGRTRQRWGQRFGAAALLSVVGAGVQLSQPQRARDSLGVQDPGQVAAGELGLNLGRLSQEILRRYVDQPPVVELSAGARLHLLVTRDLVFDQPY